MTYLCINHIDWEYDTFDIHVLNKTTKQQYQFNVEIPEHQKYWNQEIIYSYMEDNELTIVTENNFDTDDDEN